MPSKDSGLPIRGLFYPTKCYAKSLSIFDIDEMHAFTRVRFISLAEDRLKLLANDRLRLKSRDLLR